jgi:deoxyribodipyrimidine photo-lyase
MCADKMIEQSRIQPLNKIMPKPGEFVLYWMQASQRTEYNHALEFAISQANERKLPVIVYFGLTDAFPEANERHYYFMLEGLNDVRESLKRKNIGMVIERCSPETGAVKMAKKAGLVVCDRGYLKIQKKWRKYVADSIECPLIQVESNVVVPIEEASNKEEYSAATLRRKLHRTLLQYLAPLEQRTPLIDSSGFDFDCYDISNVSRVVSELSIDHSVRPSPIYHGGTKEARKHLKDFVEQKLSKYDKCRNDPNKDALSNLSPYLHFGQISTSYIASEIGRHGGVDVDAFLEELIIRRELSMNFVHNNPHYDSYTGLPNWAKQTLLEHRNDPRPYLYSREELEKAHTHDLYWNAAQMEMATTGKMHGYMRMYWGKKILEWTKAPEEAYQTALYLNNKYELDGRDPNGYTGVAWCFGKHDRPWGRRPIFGNVRFMSAEGLKRKFDADSYARKYPSENS